MNRVCAAVAFSVAAPVAVGMAALTGASASMIGAALGLTALLGACLVRQSEGVGSGCLMFSLRNTVIFLRDYGALYALGCLARSITGNPEGLPSALMSFSGAILTVARLVGQATPFILALQACIAALAMAYLAGMSTKVFVEG
jgi:hypothetical protein